MPSYAVKKKDLDEKVLLSVEGSCGMDINAAAGATALAASALS